MCRVVVVESGEQMMALNGRIHRLVPALLECLLLLHVIGYVPLAKGNCIWYGVCDDLMGFYKINCFYNGTAKPVQEETRHILEDYCPQFASGPVCCDNDQLNYLKTNIELAKDVFDRCPSCMDYVTQHICGMFCSPYQSYFIKPVKVEQFNSTHQRVMAIDYHLSTTYKEATFNYCLARPDFGPGAFESPVELMCGQYGDEDCSADRWFYLIGNTDRYFFAFSQTNYVWGDEPKDGYIPYNPLTNETNWIGIKQGYHGNEPTTIEDYDIDSTPKTGYHGNEPTTIENYDIDSTPKTEFQGYQETEPTTTADYDRQITTENDYLIIANKFLNPIKINTTDKKNDKIKEAEKETQKSPTPLDKIGCCTLNYDCELIYNLEQKKLRNEEDYYYFKKDYLKQKLVLLREQTEAFKMIAKKLAWNG